VTNNLVNVNFIRLLVLGTIYIDQTAVPNSNAYSIFPKLFKKSHPKRLAGFQDVYNKLKSMNLIHLLNSQMLEHKTKDATHQNSEFENEQWWYIGD